ncbi:hypothetical protein CJF31_00002622 [Rutstroemia sp. NJR-2017a BVV2]|nr:hypothetical protein CJF31_00002622 [Rutstroemia sp. NJR-2017a BVV2]
MDWPSIRGELERLYVTEGRSLEQVRDILLETHKFNASRRPSIRAYRNKLEEWGIRKYKTNNEGGGRCGRGQRSAMSVVPEESVDRPHSPNPWTWSWLVNNLHQSQPHTAHDHSHDANNFLLPDLPPVEHKGEDELLLGDGAKENDVATMLNQNIDGRLPSRPMKLSELLPLVHRSYPPGHALAALIRKWQADGEYMKCAMSWLKDPAYCTNILGTSQTGGNHFKLIDENVPFPERLTLTKQLLKASIIHHVQPSGPIWSVTWGVTRYIQDWQTVKYNLFDASSGVISETGSVFHLCALAVMAEELLQGHKNRFESIRGKPLRPETTSEARHIQGQYVDILKDFRDQDVDVDHSFYKYSLEILQWNESLATLERSRFDCLLAKYRRLANLWIGKETSWIESNIDGVIGDTERSRLSADSGPPTVSFSDKKFEGGTSGFRELF